MKIYNSKDDKSDSIIDFMLEISPDVDESQIIKMRETSLKKLSNGKIKDQFINELNKKAQRFLNGLVNLTFRVQSLMIRQCFILL